MNVNRLRIVMVGCVVGSFMVRKVWNWFVLFMCVVLISLFGIMLIRYCCMKKMLNVVMSVGMMMVLMELV